MLKSISARSCAHWCTCTLVNMCDHVWIFEPVYVVVYPKVGLETLWFSEDMTRRGSWRCNDKLVLLHSKFFHINTPLRHKDS